jgi:hypothetical protein
MLQQQRTALGQAGASGMKNLTGGFWNAAQAYTRINLQIYAGSGDTYNYNLGGGGPMGKMEAPTPVFKFTLSALPDKLDQLVRWTYQGYDTYCFPSTGLGYSMLLLYIWHLLQIFKGR